MQTTASAPEPIVYVVDDDAEAGRAVAELVRSCGHQSETFSSPSEYLAHLEEIDDFQTGCVVFDLRMPGMDGIGLRARMVESERPLPCICVTAYAETASTVKLLRSGVLAVLDKPVRENELWSFIQEALAKSEQDQTTLRHRRLLEQRLRSLSPPDRQVLQLILEGCKNRTMSKRLGVSLRTVENRRRRVFSAMQAESVAELTRMVMEFEHDLPPTPATDDAWLALPFEPAV